eukprot:jgi/Tetstr1/460851/TSEL_006011.t1
MVAVWRAGSERKADMNDSQWSAVKNQQRDPTVVLKKGEAGFKEWDDLRNWLKLTGWVDVEWEDEEGDPRAPDEDAIADAAELQQRLLWSQWEAFVRPVPMRLRRLLLQRRRHKDHDNLQLPAGGQLYHPACLASRGVRYKGLYAGQHASNVTATHL